jgi:hypothetical protein
MSIYNLIAELNEALPEGITLKIDSVVHDGFDVATLTIDDDIPTTKQAMLDAIQNLVGVFDTPMVRIKYNNSFTQEAIDIGNKILEQNGIFLYGK